MILKAIAEDPFCSADFLTQHRKSFFAFSSAKMVSRKKVKSKSLWWLETVLLWSTVINLKDLKSTSWTKMFLHCKKLKPHFCLPVLKQQTTVSGWVWQFNKCLGFCQTWSPSFENTAWILHFMLFRLMWANIRKRRQIAKILSSPWVDVKQLYSTKELLPAFLFIYRQHLVRYSCRDIVLKMNLSNWSFTVTNGT